MVTPPAPKRPRRTTARSIAQEASASRRGLRAVAVYLPVKWHAAIVQAAKDEDAPLQGLLNVACNKYYGLHQRELPPLVSPTRPVKDPHKTLTWYANIDLHMNMKIRAAREGSSVQQLIVSAVMDTLKDNPGIKALHIERGGPAYPRTPTE